MISVLIIQLKCCLRPVSPIAKTPLTNDLNNVDHNILSALIDFGFFFTNLKKRFLMRFRSGSVGAEWIGIELGVAVFLMWGAMNRPRKHGSGRGYQRESQYRQGASSPVSSSSSFASLRTERKTHVIRHVHEARTHPSVPAASFYSPCSSVVG